MNPVKYVICAATVFILSVITYRTIKLHHEAQRLAIENIPLRAQSNSLSARQEEIKKLAPMRSALAASDELKGEREARLKDQAEIISLQKKLAGYRHKGADDLAKLKRELDLEREQAERGEAPVNTNAWHDSTRSLNIELGKANNKGTGTPEDLLETWLWAVNHGNAGLLRNLHLTSNVLTEDLEAVTSESFLAMDEYWLSEVVAISLRRKSVRGSNDEAHIEFDLKRDREPTILDLWLKRDGNEWKIYSVSGTRPSK